MEDSAPTSLATLMPRNDFIAGIDVGGTKVHIADTMSSNLHRYATADFPDLYAVLDDYFAATQARPSRITVAMAGPRDDDTGDVKLTNSPWPAFSPRQAIGRYPGTSFTTTNDMVAVTAGVVAASSIDLITLKAGKPARTGTKVAITISTGVGQCAAVWSEHAGQYVYMSSEAGHMSARAYTEPQQRHLAHLSKKHAHPSIELAISGKHGIENWVEHSPEVLETPELAAAIQRAKDSGRPVGAVLLEFATEGSGAPQVAAHTILDHMGNLVGSVLADYALVYKATGGIYLTGSVSLALAEYWAEHTDFTKAFIRSGTEEHAPWLEAMLSAVPIYLVSDPHIAVTGALALAKE